MKNIESNDYDLWNQKKQQIAFSDQTSKIYFHEGDIWWCSLGLNIVSEAFGKGDDFRRPILIIKKLSGDTFIGLPLTSKEKVGSWFIDITIGGEKKWVMLYQIRMIHKKHLQRKIGELDKDDISRVKEKLEALLKLSSNHHPAEAGIDGNIPKVSKV